MTEVKNYGFTALTQDEMESIDGGFLIATVFLAGVVTGLIIAAALS